MCCASRISYTNTGNEGEDYRWKCDADRLSSTSTMSFIKPSSKDAGSDRPGKSHKPLEPDQGANKVHLESRGILREAYDAGDHDGEHDPVVSAVDDGHDVVYDHVKELIEAIAVKALEGEKVQKSKAHE